MKKEDNKKEEELDKYKGNYLVNIAHDYVKIMQKTCRRDGTVDENMVSIPTCLLKTIFNHIEITNALESEKERHYLQGAHHVNQLTINVWHLKHNINFTKKFKRVEGDYSEYILKDVTD